MLFIPYLKLGGFVSSAMKMYCDTKSCIYWLSTGGISLCLNPASRRCDSMEACAHGASMMGMKPFWQCAEVCLANGEETVKWKRPWKLHPG